MSTIQIDSLRNEYLNNETSVREVWKKIYEKALSLEKYNIFIHLLDEKEIEPYLKRIEEKSIEELPLWGIPFVVKDNIDLAGIPTTAACKEFSYIPEENATVVELLLNAGALPIGKSNMDQFATGLVGTRSPFGAVKNAYHPDYISGGSSSGSAVAVAKGLAAFSLGTDTAGSGRVPASLNNLVGWKPSLGAWSNHGVVPACESIDCVSVFTHTLHDAITVDTILREYDAKFEYSKKFEKVKTVVPKTIYLPKDLPTFFGSKKLEYEKKWCDFTEYITKNYNNVVMYDTEILSQAASVLYDGPWVVERFVGLEGFLEDNADTLYPTTKAIICNSKNQQFSAIDLFKAIHKLDGIKHHAHELLEDSVLILPTNGGTYTIDEVNENPIETNSKMGLYTNHCNLLDLAAVNIPIGFVEKDFPMGITLFSKSGNEGYNTSIASQIEAAFNGESVEIAVCGLHMKGFPLEKQLTDLGAVYSYTTTTTDDYKMYKLDTIPAKPGLVKVLEGGSAQEIEIWEMPGKNLHKFLSNIPSPLGLGSVTTIKNSNVIGFICEPIGVVNAIDITLCGGWRYHSN